MRPFLLKKKKKKIQYHDGWVCTCLLYTSDAADDKARGYINIRRTALGNIHEDKPHASIIRLSYHAHNIASGSVPVEEKYQRCAQIVST